MLFELFSPPSHTELEDLDEPARKKARTEAAAFEEEVLKQEGIPDTSQTNNNNNNLLNVHIHISTSLFFSHLYI